MASERKSCMNDTSGSDGRGGGSRSTSESTGQRAVTDDTLVDWLREGDRTAFDELYRRYFRRVYGFLDKRLRNFR